MVSTFVDALASTPRNAGADVGLVLDDRRK
jgi:hypothetical protein